MIQRLIKNLFREVGYYPGYDKIPYILRKVGNITHIFNKCTIEKLNFDKWRIGGSLKRNKQNNDSLFRFVII